MHTSSTEDEERSSHIDAVLGTIRSTCPNATSLHLSPLFKGRPRMTAPLFRIIGQHLPHLLELRVDHLPDYGVFEQWAEFLPPGLRKLSLPGLELSHKMLIV